MSNSLAFLLKSYKIQKNNSNRSMEMDSSPLVSLSEFSLNKNSELHHENSNNPSDKYYNSRNVNKLPNSKVNSTMNKGKIEFQYNLNQTEFNKKAGNNQIRNIQFKRGLFSQLVKPTINSNQTYYSRIKNKENTLNQFFTVSNRIDSEKVGNNPVIEQNYELSKQDLKSLNLSPISSSIVSKVGTARNMHSNLNSSNLNNDSLLYNMFKNVSKSNINESQTDIVKPNNVYYKKGVKMLSSNSSKILDLSSYKIFEPNEKLNNDNHLKNEIKGLNTSHHHILKSTEHNTQNNSAIPQESSKKSIYRVAFKQIKDNIITNSNVNNSKNIKKSEFRSNSVVEGVELKTQYLQSINKHKKRMMQEYYKTIFKISKDVTEIPKEYLKNKSTNSPILDTNKSSSNRYNSINVVQHGTINKDKPNHHEVITNDTNKITPKDFLNYLIKQNIENNSSTKELCLSQSLDTSNKKYEINNNFYGNINISSSVGKKSRIL